MVNRKKEKKKQNIKLNNLFIKSFNKTRKILGNQEDYSVKHICRTTPFTVNALNSYDNKKKSTLLLKLGFFLPHNS